MALLDGVLANYQLLSKEWSKKPPDLKKCGELLGNLKVTLTQLPFLPTSDTSVSKRELLLARDILEIGAQWSIKTRDIPSFERYMAQLKCYYLDYQVLGATTATMARAEANASSLSSSSRPVAHNIMQWERNDLPESAQKYELLGLNLLCLLAQNRVAEFHTELELLPAKEIQSNVYINHPVRLEQFLMEGSYNKVFKSKDNVPAANYSFFMDILLDTVRDEIARCIEKAYDRISSPEVTRMLFLDSPQLTDVYASKRGWTATNNVYQFSTEVKHTEDVISTEDLASQAIGYARELEMIV